MLDRILHKWLKLPYTLYVRHIRRPKRPIATYVFIHGIGNSGEAWSEVIAELPDNVRIITVDLLGFGSSPKPTWATYNAATQARSVIATLLALRIVGKVVLVGHSLGSLVAIEVAKKCPMIIESLLLCSPPLYTPNDMQSKLPIQSDKMLRALYQSALRRPDQFVAIASFAMRYNLINKSFNVTHENVSTYMTALEAMIINQTSYDDARQLTVPVHIMEGTLDPFVLHSRLKRLTKQNPNITLQTVLAGHEVRGLFVKALIKRITVEVT
jgi:pimeloyl-ACP methyl ester carboxylesterase